MHPELSELIQRFPDLEPCVSDVEAAFELLRGVFEEGGKLLLCGNGGSAADAEHIAGELMKGFHNPRPLKGEEKELLGEELGRDLQGALPAIPLTGFPSLSTACANDMRPELVFAQMTWALGRAGDAILGISTSGNSPNVLHALRAARARGLRTSGLTGQSGGSMPGLCDVCIRVPATRVDRVQELHLPVYHCLCAMLEGAFFNSP